MYVSTGDLMILCEHCGASYKSMHDINQRLKECHRKQTCDRFPLDGHSKDNLRNHKENKDKAPGPEKRAPKRKLPSEQQRLDQVSHWPMPNTDKRRCAYCKIGQTRMRCEKCQVPLCLNNNNNCFIDFHQ